MPALNDEIREYLKYYVGLESPPYYAVLLKGDWGAGKTWFIQDFCKSLGEDRFLKVSLFGVKSSDEIEEQFFQQLHPLLTSKVIKVGATLLKGVLKNKLGFEWKSSEGKITGSLEPPQISIKDFLENANDKVLVFDDLERCNMGQDEVLGYINTFVELLGQRVIILSNETEIKFSDEYRRKREKVIGRTFSIRADLEGAILPFLRAVVGQPCRTTLENNASGIIAVYERANCRNLRTLRQSILEYERFFQLMPQKAKDNAEFQQACIECFFSVSIELAAARLKPDAIVGLKDRHIKKMVQDSVNKKKQGSGEPGAVAEDAFFDGIFKTHQMLVPNEQALASFFETGLIPPDVIEEAIQGSPYFLSTDTPTWVQLWNFWHMEDEKLPVLYTEVKSNFEKSLYTNQGEILHVAGMLLFFARKRIIGDSIKKTAAFILTTLTKMSAANQIEVPVENDEHHRGPITGYRAMSQG